MEMGTHGKKKFKYDIVADQILNEIKTGVWTVGDKLPAEAKLIERYGVSRVCLREALKKLSVIGILNIVQGDGTYVNELIPSHVFEPFLPLLSCKEVYVEEIYDARYVVEGGAAQLFAGIRTEQDLADLKVELDEMQDASSQDDLKRFSTHDRRFHEIIIDRCGNPILAAVGKMFQEIALEYTRLLNGDSDVVQRSQYEHQMLYWAFQDQKVNRAKGLMEMHMERSKENLVELMRLSSHSGQVDAVQNPDEMDKT